MSLGLRRNTCLTILGISKNQFYYSKTGKKIGKSESRTTTWRDPETLLTYEVENNEVIDKIIEYKLDPDEINWYRMLTRKLQIDGYYINHKKVYRLMKSYDLLELPRTKKKRNFVKYRRVCPTEPLQVLEMDIKYVWVYGMGKYAFILTVIDTFTRYVLHWDVGYTMKSHQVKVVWEYIIVKYLQPAGLLEKGIDVELRNDNGKQFSANIIIDFFKENKLNQVFTHPYTPEENGHVESFHAILGKALKNDEYASLEILERRLERFYLLYNNKRSHSGTIGISPSKFWTLFELGKIEVVPLAKRKVKFKLKVAYQDILTIPMIDKYDMQIVRRLSGNMN